MPTTKIEADSTFPELIATNLKDEKVDLRNLEEGTDWKMIIVYRGRHCPLCTKYLNSLEAYSQRLKAIGIHLVAVSGDNKSQLEEHLTRLEINYPIYYGLTLDQMMRLGLYISHPRSEKETDHPFAEPGFFIINETGTVQAVDISNNPWARPNLEVMVSGLEWIRKNDYPIRGTYPYSEAIK